MAPTNTPGRKKRENQFFEPGVQGRKTGLTLKDTGVRDEYGLEPTEGIFSSPEKQPARSTAPRTNGTATSSSEAMDVAESSAPEPIEVLSSRRQPNGMLPLPKGRSPIKTNIGATPKRGSSVGAQSPFKAQSSNRASSHPTVNRRLDYSITETDIEESLAQDEDIYDVPETQEDSGSFEAPLAHEEESEIQVNGTLEDSPGRQFQDDLTGEDTVPGSEALEGESVTIIEVVQAQPNKRGKKRKSDIAVIADLTEIEQDNNASLADESQTAPVAKKRRGRPPQDKPAAVEEVERSPAAQLVRPTRRGRGRHSNVSTADSVDAPADHPEPMDDDAPVDDAQPMEDIMDAPEEDTRTTPEPPKQRGRKKKTPAERDANAKIVSSKGAKKAGAKAQALTFKSGVGFQRIRSQTPGQDDASSRTRSGRLTTKPFDYWKGEKAIFTAGYRPGLAGIQQIIRVEEATPVKKPVYHASTSRRKTSNRVSRNVSIFGGPEEDDEEVEQWENEEGIVSGAVRVWDSEVGAVPTDEEREQQLAFASNKISPRPSPDNPNFCFTKTLTMPFFGAGVIELPPHGYKGTKNSRRFQFLFFVHYGKVAVEVAGNRFVIGKGGMWQVPRGNFYSITNETDKAAKIVFAQGCEAETAPVQASQLADTSVVGDTTIA